MPRSMTTASQGVVYSMLPPRAEEAGGAERVEHRRARKVELGERLVGKDARAVNRVARLLVLLEEGNRKSALCQLQRRVQSSRTASNYGDIVHRVMR